MSEDSVLRPQQGPQEKFVNLMDDVPLVFYGGEVAPRCCL